MSVWADQHVERRQGELHRKEPDPNQVHEFLPSRKLDDDTCVVCHREFEDQHHPPIGFDELE